MTPKSEALGHRRHGGDEQQRVEVRALQPLAQRRLRPAAEHVVGTDDVREEDAVESAVLEDAGQLESSSSSSSKRWRWLPGNGHRPCVMWLTQAISKRLRNSCFFSGMGQAFPGF